MCVCVETAITINYAKPFGQCSCKLPGKSLSAGVSKLYVLFRMVGSPEIYRGDYSDMELIIEIYELIGPYLTFIILSLYYH